MSRRLAGFVVVAAFATILAGPTVAGAQLSETAAFLADLSNQYRSIPNVVYHVANNHENKLDVYIPNNAPGPTPVMMVIHGGGWVTGNEGGAASASDALPRDGVGCREYDLSPRSGVPSARCGRRLPLCAPVDRQECRGVQLRSLAHRDDRELCWRTPGLDQRHDSGLCGFGAGVRFWKLYRSADHSVSRRGRRRQLVWHHRRG